MRLVLTILSVLLLHSSPAQLPSTIRFTNYTRATGLPEENINNISEDGRGYIWIGSREGLFRFDGLHFKSWYADPADPTGFPNNNIMVGGETAGGDLLFISGTELWQINTTNQYVHQNLRFRNKQILSLPVRFAGQQWVILDPDSAYVTNAELNVLHSYALQPLFAPGTQVAAFPLEAPWILLYSAQNGRYGFLNTINGSMTAVHFDDSGIDERSRFYTPQLYDARNKRLYLSTYFNGNFYCTLNVPGTREYHPSAWDAQPAGGVRRSAQTTEGYILQAGENGLAVTDGQSSMLFNDETVREKPPVSRLMLDIIQAHDGSCWIASTKGISHFSLQRPQIGYIRLFHDQPEDDEFKSILKGADDQIYFLTTGSSLSRLDMDKGVVMPCNRDMPYGWSAATQGDEIIVTGGPRVLFSYNTRTGRTSRPDVLKPYFTRQTDVVTLVFVSRNHDRWYSCNGGGGLIRQPAGTDRFIQYDRNTTPPAFSHSYVHAAAEDRWGNIWWGSNKSDKLLKWDAVSGTFTESDIGKLIPGFKGQAGINNLFADAGDNLWIALDGAALIRYHLPDRKGTYYDIHHGMPSDAVGGISADAQKRIWFGTRKGICCYVPETDNIISFNAADGLPDDDFEGNGLYFDAARNLIIAGSGNAVCWFNPDTLLKKATASPPPVFMDGMKVNGQPFFFRAGTENVLHPDENNIEIGFSSPDFTRNGHLQFQYRLNGREQPWTDLGENRSVSFHNLTPGEYVLSVRCRYTGNPEWTATTLPLYFRIETPWQQSTWFRLLLVLSIAGLVFYLIRNYYRQKLEKQKAASEKLRAVEMERTRIATDMHDDFGASLSRIKFISEKVQLYELPDTSVQSDLHKISRYSDEMAEKMNEIIWALNQRYDSCSDLVSFCRLYASEYFQDSTVRFRFQTTGIPDRKIPGEERRNIFLVIKEALHNIKKHAEATHAELSFVFNGAIEVRISDDGKGFDAAHVRPFSNGLANMKKRMQDVGGTIEFISGPGTCIILKVPL